MEVCYLLFQLNDVVLRLMDEKGNTMGALYIGYLE